MKIVSFSLEGGNRYFGRVDGGSKFFIGKRVPYLGGKGLSNTEGSTSERYDRASYRGTHGFWADFLHPTSMAEGSCFHTLNTYDTAQFTFGFMQFAAHTANGDFVTYFRELLRLPDAEAYFPDLILENGHIAKRTDHGTVPLETNASSEPLMRYLNPTRQQIEDTEVIQSARFIHWVQNDAAHRDKMVEVAVSLWRRNMAGYAKQYKLDGAADVVCLMVADIRHQGRAKSPAILAALKSPKPFEALLKIGAGTYAERITTLKSEIKKLTQEGTFGTKRYELASGNFV